jgi:hypothetical protein
MDHKSALPDGVYVGFTGSFAPGNPLTHNFLTIIHDGVPRTYEYGPKASADQYGTPNGADRNAEVKYKHTPDTAEFGLVRVPAPPGVTEDQFEQRIKEGVERYRALPSYEKLPYDGLNGANCENMISGLLKYAGSSQADIEAIASAHAFGSIDPHFSKPVDVKALFDSLPSGAPPTPFESLSIEAVEVDSETVRAASERSEASTEVSTQSTFGTNETHDQHGKDPARTSPCSSRTYKRASEPATDSCMAHAKRSASTDRDDTNFTLGSHRSLHSTWS